MSIPRPSISPNLLFSSIESSIKKETFQSAEINNNKNIKLPKTLLKVIGLKYRTNNIK